MAEHDPALLEALTAAFVDDGPERSYHYDRDSARVVSVLEDHEDRANDELVWQLESDTRGRFVPVPKPNLEDVLAEQDAFVESLDPGCRIRARLEELLEGDPDGSKFIRFVNRDEEARSIWRRFRAARARVQAETFLSRLGEESGPD